MKIAMIGHKHVPSREGGIEVAVGELAQRMVAQGHTVELYNRLDGCAPQPITQTFCGARIHQIPTLRFPAVNAFLYSFLATGRAVWGSYDVIHFHAEGPAAMLLLPKLLGIPTVVTIHGLDWQRTKWNGFAAWYLHLGERIAAKYADEIIVLSHRMQEYFRLVYHRETRYISNGVTPHPAANAELIASQFGLQKDGYILYLGRLVPEKNVHLLIEAFHELRTEKKLVITGRIDGSAYAQQVYSLAEQDRRIVMTDFAEGRMLDELLSNAFCCVLPSELEGQALALLEAMGSGVRCLVSDISENVEAGAGYVETFQAGNTAHLREKLAELLEESREFALNEQVDFVKRTYNWDKVVAETLKVYESAIQKRQRKEFL